MNIDEYRPWHTVETNEKRNVFYSIRSDGKVISTTKKHYVEKVVNPHMTHGGLIVIINKKTYRLRCLVAKYFSEEYKEGMSVLHKDGNPYNCKIENLIICDKKTAGKLTGGLSNSKKIIVTDKETGECKTYNSIIEFCRKNYISQRAFYDWKQGRVKKSILQRYKIVELKK